MHSSDALLNSVVGASPAIRTVCGPASAGAPEGLHITSSALPCCWLAAAWVSFAGGPGPGTRWRAVGCVDPVPRVTGSWWLVAGPGAVAVPLGTVCRSSGLTVAVEVPSCASVDES
jgi:hypothetical protein